MFDNTSISFVFITDGIPKKIRSLVVLLIVISLYSCRHSQCYKYDVTELSIDSIYSDTLVGSPIPINMENVDVIYCIDTVFLVHRTARYDKYYYNVYSNITFDSITSFGIKGRSRHEFTMSPMNFTKQVFVRNGDYIIPLMDNAVCKEINLNKTLSQGFTYVEQMTEGVNFLNGTVVFFGENYDRLFVFIKGTADNIYEEDEVLPKIVYANENGKEEVTSVYYHYPPNYTDDESSLFYDGVIYKQPEGNIVAQPLERMSYVMYYDIENKKYHAIHIQGARRFEDGIPYDEEERNAMAFSDDAVITKDFILVHYWGDYTKMRTIDSDYMGRLLMIDWEGRLIKSYILHDWIHKITYDTSNNILYGLNYWNGKFYSFGSL